MRIVMFISPQGKIYFPQADLTLNNSRRHSLAPTTLVLCAINEPNGTRGTSRFWACEVSGLAECPLFPVFCCVWRNLSSSLELVICATKKIIYRLKQVSIARKKHLTLDYCFRNAQLIGFLVFATQKKTGSLR